MWSGEGSEGGQEILQTISFNFAKCKEAGDESSHVFGGRMISRSTRNGERPLYPSSLSLSGITLLVGGPRAPVYSEV